MCGIAGAIWTDPRFSLPQGVIERMTDALQHRGPDDRGVYYSDWKHDYTGRIQPGVGLGFRRLSIIDLAGGHQPQSNEDDTIFLIFNGEIYNYRDLRRRLEGSGHRFKTDSDTETIIHLYEDLGTKCFEHLNGMFSIAIWDTRKNQLILARDRLGKKPLYFAHQPGRLMFASEAKSLAVSGDMPTKISHEAIDLFLTYQYVPHPHSIWEGVSKLSPGHFAVYHNDRLDIQSFWNPDFNKEVACTRDDAIEHLRSQLTDSVRLRLRSDVPLGAFLSGGIDSSLIAAIAQKELQQPLKTFSIGFSEKDFDETHFAQMVADKIGSQHQRFEVTPDALSILDQLVYHYDEPFGDSSAIPTWYLSQMTGEHVTVALSGDGGDELFAGYERYRALWLSARTQSWLPINKILKLPLIQNLPTSTAQRSFLRRVKRYGEALDQPPERRYMNWIQIFSEAARVELYRDDFLESLPNRDPADFVGRAWDRSSKRDLITKASLGDVLTYIPCDLMTKVDIASMAHSLEVRQPFLDYRLVEWAATLPVSLKFRWGRGKQLLHDAFAGWIPDIIWKRPKMGFGVPIGRWFRGPLRAKAESMLLSNDTRCTTYFRPEAIKSLVDRHMDGTRDEAYRLWNLFFFEAWLRKQNG